MSGLSQFPAYVGRKPLEGYVAHVYEHHGLGLEDVPTHLDLIENKFAEDLARVKIHLADKDDDIEDMTWEELRETKKEFKKLNRISDGLKMIRRVFRSHHSKPKNRKYWEKITSIVHETFEDDLKRQMKANFQSSHQKQIPYTGIPICYLNFDQGTHENNKNPAILLNL